MLGESFFFSKEAAEGAKPQESLRQKNRIKVDNLESGIVKCPPTGIGW